MPRIRVLMGRRAVVPEWLLMLAPSANAIRLYAILDARYATGKGQAFPSRDTLRRDLGVRSVRTVDAAIQQLVSVGALTVQRRKRAGSNAYTSSLYLLRHEQGGSAADRTSVVQQIALPSAADRTSVPRTYVPHRRVTPARSSIEGPRRGGLRHIGQALP